MLIMTTTTMKPPTLKRHAAFRLSYTEFQPSSGSAETPCYDRGSRANSGAPEFALAPFGSERAKANNRALGALSQCDDDDGATGLKKTYYPTAAHDDG